MYRPYTRAPFDSARCTGCGECLRQCPVLHLPLPRAKEEIGRLRAQAVHGAQPMDHRSETTAHRPLFMARRLSSVVLRRCTSCLACNQVCPEDCRPANLILDLWHEEYLEEGLPARAAWFLPHARPNFRTYILDRLPQDERETVQGWRHGGPAREFLYAGCNLVTTPYLTLSRLFDGLEIRGGLDFCCGEMLFRMGLYESVEQVARRLTLWFRRLGAERVYLVCTAGLNLLSNILPQFGADFSGIEFVPFQQVILERLRSGELRAVRPVYHTVTVQDSCHARTAAPGFAGLPRRVLEAIGVQVRESPASRDSQLCCGIGGGFSHASAYNPFSLLLSARRTSRDHRRVPADATCVYCSGCLEMMSVARFADPNRRPVLHLLELVQQAVGERPRRRQSTLAWQFLIGALRYQFPRLPNRERFWLPEIAPDPDPAEAR